jgi:hypothetical protein
MIDIRRWLMPWRPRKQSTSGLPLGLDQQDIDALTTLRAFPQWSRYIAVIERLGEQQASALATGLPHEKYLFASGALTALRRVYTLADDLIAAATNIEELAHARDRKLARSAARYADTFVNTPWYDGWCDDIASPS